MIKQELLKAISVEQIYSLELYPDQLNRSFSNCWTTVHRKCSTSLFSNQRFLNMDDRSYHTWEFVDSQNRNGQPLHNEQIHTHSPIDSFPPWNQNKIHPSMKSRTHTFNTHPQMNSCTEATQFIVIKFSVSVCVPLTSIEHFFVVYIFSLFHCHFW